jgi:2-C-methyl-D-erythritol 4-phosphate cytidylyltransferase
MIIAILLSGGLGSRMDKSIPKQYLLLGGKPIAFHSYQLLRNLPQVSEIIVVCKPKYETYFKGAIFAPPGRRRQDSLFNAVQRASPKASHFLIHDAARPLLIEEDVKNVLQAGKKFGAATLATPVKATIKEADKDLFVVQTLERSHLYEIHTPQVLKKELLLQGFELLEKSSQTISDDVSLAELVGHPVKLVMGSYENIKITTPEDLVLAESILRERSFLSQI